jgi:hypothetical protein
MLTAAVPCMNRQAIKKIIALLLLFSSVSLPGLGQHIRIDTEEIESLIREWDFANNTRSIESFSKVYDDTLLFYTQTLTESKAIALKQKLFRSKPHFRQRISTSIKYTPFTSGVTKCDFTKEVLEGSGWKPYPSYLLVSYYSGRYWIVGESDHATDKTLRFTLQLGEPMTFENVSDVSEPVFGDSLFKVSAPDDPSLFTSSTKELDTLLRSLDPLTIFPDLSRFGFITVPKGYVFILVGFLAVGGIMIFIADTLRAPRKKKTGTVLQRPDEADRAIADFKMQSVFEAFVITLFDPLYFDHRRPKTERVLAGNASNGKSDPDLEFEFNHKDVRARFSVKCQYYKGAFTREVRLSSPKHLQSLHDFAEGRETPFYYILGFGGAPDDPQELFLVPAKAIKHEVISKAALKPYSKSGMFFYNSNKGTLQ